MSNIDIIRAWKDEDYFNSLSEEMRSQLPENPAGIIELADTEMEAVAGGLGWSNPSWVDACPSALGCPNPSWVDACPSVFPGCPGPYDPFDPMI